MPTRNVSLTPQQDLFVERLVTSGEYQNASEAIRDGLRALQQRRREDVAKIRRLRAAVNEGIAELDRGEYVEVAAGTTRDFVRSLLPAVSGPRRPVPRSRRTGR